MRVPTITDIKTMPLCAPLERPVKMAIGEMRGRNGVLVEVTTDAGIVGIGESWVNYPSWAPTERTATILEGVRPLLIGERIDDPRRLWRLCTDRLRLLALQWSAKGPINQAVSGVDIALWDIAGKAAGVPIWQLLGAPKQDRVRAYASGLGPLGANEQAAAAMVHGFTAVKLKLGFDQDFDERNLAAVRATIGGATLFTDANQGWTLERARAMLGPLRAAQAAWLEEPLPADEAENWRQLREQVGALPLAAGENLYGLPQFAHWGNAHLVDVLQPDVGKCGGISAMTAILETAANQGLRLAPHYFGGAVGLAATLHVFASLPPAQRVLVEYDINPNPLREELLTEELYVGNGELRVPTEPGLGVTLRQDTLARFGIG